MTGVKNHDKVGRWAHHLPALFLPVWLDLFKRGPHHHGELLGFYCRGGGTFVVGAGTQVGSAALSVPCDPRPSLWPVCFSIGGIDGVAAVCGMEADGAARWYLGGPAQWGASVVPAGFRRHKYPKSAHHRAANLAGGSGTDLPMDSGMDGPGSAVCGSVSEHLGSGSVGLSVIFYL